MGSNQNRHFDKGIDDWGKQRKANARQQKQSLENAAIEDQINPGVTHSGKRRKKDTKRWCRGKVGKEHEFKPFLKWPSLNSKFSVRKCSVCGKENWSFR